MTQPLRTSNVVRYRRFVQETMVTALQTAFNNTYSRERQFADLKIATSYGLKKTDYPAIVVDFADRQVRQAGVGHTEWFQDANGILRQWAHAFFQGTLNLKIYGLSTYDRDHLADAVVELIQFGRLDLQLDQFYVAIYGADDAPVSMIFNQIMLNTDVMNSMGNSATIAPWQPEDQLVYQTGYSMDLSGGFYNYVPTDIWSLVSAVTVFPYPQDSVNITVPVIPQSGQQPFTNPFLWTDEGKVMMIANISAGDMFDVSYGRGLYSGGDYGN